MRYSFGNVRVRKTKFTQAINILIVDVPALINDFVNELQQGICLAVDGERVTAVADLVSRQPDRPGNRRMSGQTVVATVVLRDSEGNLLALLSRE